MARSLYVSLASTALLALLTPGSRGQAGTLDSSFGDGGLVVTDVQGPSNRITAGLVSGIDGDGRIVIATTNVGQDMHPVLLVARVSASGMVDPSFDGDGHTTTALWSTDPLYAADPRPTGIAFDGDRIVVVGWGYSLGGPSGTAGIFALRYLEDGTLDPSFGSDGLVIVDAPFAMGCVVRDGKTYIAAHSSPASIVCLDATGSPDPSFGSNGVATLPGLFNIIGLSLTDDGRITASGTSSTSQAVLAVRLLQDGSVDTSFDLDGTAVVGVNSGAQSSSLQPLAIACGSDDTVIVAMDRRLGAPTHQRRIELVRLLPNGSIDTSFGGGWVAWDYRYWSAMALEAGGAVLITGYDDLGDYTARRITREGAIDSTFGSGGVARVSLPDQSLGTPSSIAAHPDGGSVLVGDSGSSLTLTWGLAVVQLTAGGIADAGFGGSDGALIMPVLGSCTDYGKDVVAMQGDGKIVVLGQSTDSTTVVARYETDGDLDPTFGDQGLVESQTWREPTAVAIQAGGRILVACSRQGLQSDMAIVGLTSAGQLDPAFGIGGMAALVHPGGAASAANALTTLADGSILVAGALTDPSTFWMSDVVVAKLHADGSLDASFGTLGFTTFGSPGVNERATSIATFSLSGAIAVGGTVSGTSGTTWIGLALLDAGGLPATPFATTIAFQPNSSGATVDVAVDATDRLYLSGGLVPESNAELAVARVLPDRTLDPTFGSGGIARAAFGPAGTLLAATASLAVQGDGRPVAAGVAGAYSWFGIDGDFSLARWNADGALDDSFGDGGRATADFGAIDLPAAVAIQGDGGIVVAGTTANLLQSLGSFALPTDIAVARFHGVTTPEGLISELVPVVEEFVEEGLLTHGESSSLQKKLEASLQQVDKGKPAAAANQLTAFVNQVNALVNSGRLAPVDGAHLADWATSARDLILGG